MYSSLIDRNDTFLAISIFIYKGGIMSAQQHAHRIKISVEVSEEERILHKNDCC
jgi:hypothetical protein